MMNLFKVQSKQKFDTVGEDIIFDKVVSLGGTCQIAYQLNRLGLRYESYPFDWLFSTNPETLVEAIENDFKDWLKFENLREDSYTTTEHKRVFDNKYDMIHQHIFPLDKELKDSYKDVKRTADRRIRRFLDLQKGNKRILFVRSELNDAQTERLGTVLRKKYGKNAVLLVVRYIKEFEIRRVECNVSNAVVYEVYDENENTGQNWRGYDTHWNKILGRVKVNTETVNMSDDSVFENFYNCEKNENGEKFRWSNGKSVLHLEKYGGLNCTLSFSAPVATKLKILDVYGNEIHNAKHFLPFFKYSFKISHATRYITLVCEKVWRPCDISETTDDRELGVCLKNILVKR